jgi:hypothetical protein
MNHPHDKPCNLVEAGLWWFFLCHLSIHPVHMTGFQGGSFMLSKKKFAACFEDTRFAIRRNGSSLLIVHDFAMFHVTADDLPALMCPEQDGDYLYTNIMPTSSDARIRPCPAPTLALFTLWQDVCNAQALSPLEIIEVGKPYCQCRDTAGNVHFLGRWLTDIFSSSLQRLQKAYRFEALSRHRVRMFAASDASLPIAMLMECLPDQPSDPLGLNALLRQAMAAAVRLRTNTD